MTDCETPKKKRGLFIKKQREVPPSSPDLPPSVVFVGPTDTCSPNPAPGPVRHRPGPLGRRTQTGPTPPTPSVDFGGAFYKPPRKERVSTHSLYKLIYPSRKEPPPISPERKGQGNREQGKQGREVETPEGRGSPRKETRAAGEWSL